jgi:3-hydroxyisobutyrate dehydrogenase
MRTGFIGLGAMGIPMAYHLHKQGYLIGVWNRTASKAQTFAEETGLLYAQKLSELAQQCNLIITCVSRDEDVLEVIDELRPNLQPNSIVVDVSTTSPQTARSLANRLREQDVAFLDAPVTGGVEGAKKGRLAMMVGGEESVLQRVRPILGAFSQRIEHMGNHGQGQAAKAVNQLMAAGINQAVSQSLAFARALELPLDKIIDIIASGAAGNWFLQHRGKTMTQGQFSPGFRVALHHKDLLICETLGREMGMALPVAQATLEDYKKLMDMGYGDDDISALYRLKALNEDGDL